MAPNDNPASGAKRMCVACQSDVSGRRALPVKEDRIIRVIRAVKKSLGIAQNNQLFVCENCMSKHNERRRSFEKTLLFASVLAGIMLVLLILVPMLSGRFEVWAILSGIIVAGFVVLVPILFKYVPAVAGTGAPVLPSTPAGWVPPVPAIRQEPAPFESRAQPPQVAAVREQPSAPPPAQPEPQSKGAREPKQALKIEGKAKEKSIKKARKK